MVLDVLKRAVFGELVKEGFDLVDIAVFVPYVSLREARAPSGDAVDPLPSGAWLYPVLSVEILSEEGGPKRLEVPHGFPHRRARVLREEVEACLLVGS